MLQRTFSVLSLLETCPFIKDKALGLYVSFSPVLQSVHPPPHPPPRNFDLLQILTKDYFRSVM